VSFRKAAVVFGLGFFALVAQTVLFRAFLTAFEGNELGVGAFFASWLVSVAVGAVAGRLAAEVWPRLMRHVDGLAMAYLPAFALQLELTARARDLASVEVYEAFPVLPMVAVAFVVNVPVSLATGFLFTAACRWIEGDARLPVARVYVVETLGACVGGVAVTILLAVGVSGETVVVVAMGVLAVGVAATRPERVVRWIPVAACVAALVLGGGERWADRGDRAQWTRLLTAEAYQGCFATAQARYLFGAREDQFVVVSGGGVCEALPDREHGAEVAALHLAQQPEAKRVLVIGPGALSICAQFIRFPSVERVTWLPSDPEFAGALLPVLPSDYAEVVGRLDIPGVDVRRFIDTTDARYDLAVVNLPDVTTLVLNRYCTQEFFLGLRGILAEGGVVSVRVSGGENYLGGELTRLGASMLTTLDSVFRSIVLKPGGESWLIASDSDGLSMFARGLLNRYKRIDGAEAVYPPEGVARLYPADRIAFQMDAYKKVQEESTPALLLNTDGSPKALLFSLLVALRKAGWRSVGEELGVLLSSGLFLAICPAILYVLLRCVYLFRGGRGLGSRAFDGEFLVFSSGAVGMALSVALMFVYQARFGSLFLHVGVIAALYMAGAGIGGAVATRLLDRRGSEPPWALPCFTAVVLGVLALAWAIPDGVPRVWFVLLFGVGGAAVGACFPLAVHRLAASGRTAASAGAGLETLDHVGGAVGALLTGLVLLPLWGVGPTLAVLALVMVANLPAMAFPPAREAVGDWFDRRTRPGGYLLVGVAACCLIGSHVVTAGHRAVREEHAREVTRTLVGDTEVDERHAVLPDGCVLEYYETSDEAECGKGYVFLTPKLAPGVMGFGGPIILAMYVGGDGELRSFRIVESHETPIYEDRLASWLGSLAGRNLLAKQPFAGVDAVAGATITTDAILRTLETAGRNFASQVLGQIPTETETRREVHREFVILAAFTAMAIGIRYRPNAWVRRMMLLASVAVLGFGLNLQYSTHQVMALLGGRVNAASPTGPVFLALVVPAVVVLFGNVYCGQVCPFGALQELVGELCPARYRGAIDKGVWRYGRAAKYVLLALLVLLFAVTRAYDVLDADPLISVFSAVRTRSVEVLAVLFVLLSAVFPRFWCRNLCPAGAFLALANGLGPWRRHVPTPRPARCDLGVRTVRELDCIYCDRCRRGAKEDRREDA